jgi:REP element-mobilizing transposase RayT
LTTRKGFCIREPYSCYFFTITAVGWIDVFTRKECKDIVIQALNYCQKKKGLVLNAFVIMPSHIHLIARADIKSAGISGIIRDFKKYTSKEIFRWINQNKKESRRDWMIRLL